MQKIHKKIWVYSGACLILLTGGFFGISYFSSGSSDHSPVSSNCKFNPEIDENIQALIKETIVTVANGSLFSLMGKEDHLRKIGDIISNETSDFAYWGYVFSSPLLATDMKKIQSSSAKYEGFLGGVQHKLMQEYRENPCLMSQAKGFAKYLHLPENEILAVLQECIDNSNKSKYAFRPYLDYLIAKKSSG